LLHPSAASIATGDAGFLHRNGQLSANRLRKKFEDLKMAGEFFSAVSRQGIIGAFLRSEKILDDGSIRITMKLEQKRERAAAALRLPDAVMAGTAWRQEKFCRLLRFWGPLY